MRTGREGPYTEIRPNVLCSADLRCLCYPCYSFIINSLIYTNSFKFDRETSSFNLYQLLLTPHYIAMSVSFKREKKPVLPSQC